MTHRYVKSLTEGLVQGFGSVTVVIFVLWLFDICVTIEVVVK